ncbi:acylphosphatase [Enterococcus sp. LJL98]
MRKVRMRVTGRVQGVGFRYLTKIAADELGIFGSAKNEEDGSVRIEATGPEKELDTFIEKVKASPAPFGRVDSFQLEEVAEISETRKFLTK